eukprot:736556-Hanusia_phi.AAC.1
MGESYNLTAFGNVSDCSLLSSLLLSFLPSPLSFILLCLPLLPCPCLPACLFFLLFTSHTRQAGGGKAEVGIEQRVTESLRSAGRQGERRLRGSRVHAGLSCSGSSLKSGNSLVL